MSELRRCQKCSELVLCTGSESPHYVPAIFHDTPPEDFGLYEPYWSCQRKAVVG